MDKRGLFGGRCRAVTAGAGGEAQGGCYTRGVGSHYQPLLFEAEVIQTGDGQATVRARRPVLEGGIEEARRALGGRRVVSRETVYRLLREGRIRGWQPRGGRPRKDGRRSNAKWVIDLGSVYEWREKCRNAETQKR